MRREMVSNRKVFSYHRYLIPNQNGYMYFTNINRLYIDKNVMKLKQKDIIQENIFPHP